ncbi:DUF2835 family protein [Ferrimonas balearica]|uniref:DUF2835 family protein n=1 Tax=Ferrimonas balearica TaxID=44012 RepID=UPI001C99E186|nr:DUF2835 family protein [Ferrimonas balearica]MBY5991579.1 DUF2835 domain-containing protein [Ferrimonas balearica]
MPSYVFDLRISSQSIRRYYQGQADLVVVRDRAGRVIHLHPRYLRPHLRPEGVVGAFCLTLGERGEFLGLERLS